MKTSINKLLSPLIIVLLMIGATSCGDDFDYNPSLENRTIYEVESYTFNDNNLDNVKDFKPWNHRNTYMYSCSTLKEYYENYFKEIHLLVWDNGKYEANVYGLRETTDPQKPKNKRVKFKRTKHDINNFDFTWYYGTIELVEVGHNRYDCEIYDDEYNVTFSATVQFNEGSR